MVVAPSVSAHPCSPPPRPAESPPLRSAVQTDCPSEKGFPTMLRKRTRTLALLVVLVIGTLAIGFARSAAVAGQATPDAQAKIASAMDAGPAAIAQNATILDNQLDADGNFVVLRDGSNGWTCLPHAPATPHLAPLCLADTLLGWLPSVMAHTALDTKTLGLAYMLQGGSDASNTDPFATTPAAGDEWIASPPHVMLLMPGKLDQSVYGTDPHSGKPWIMWAGTPYEHIMMPVGEMKNAS